MGRGEGWISAYLRAFRSGDPGEIRALFSSDVEYLPGSGSDLYRGRESLVGYWLGEPIEAGFEVRARLLAFDPVVNVAAIERRVFYPNAPTGEREISSLLVASFDGDGRCVRLEEWG